MRSLPPALLFVMVAMVSQPAAAQPAAAAAAAAVRAVPERAGRAVSRRNHIALDIGILSGGLSYARRVGATPWSVGGGVWGAWEPPNSFDRDVWEPLGATVFGRYRAASWLHTDVGMAVARYVWADDCAECSGTFVGIRSAVLAGHRFVFVGPELLAGRVSDERHGSDVGVIWGAQVRFVLGWEE